MLQLKNRIQIILCLLKPCNLQPGPKGILKPTNPFIFNITWTHPPNLGEKIQGRNRRIEINTFLLPASCNHQNLDNLPSVFGRRYFLWGHVANSKSWSTNLQSKNLGILDILGFWNAQTSRFPHKEIWPCFFSPKNRCLSIPTPPTAREEMSTLYPVTWWDWRRNETSTCRCFVVTHLLGFIQRWHVKYIYCPAVSVETQTDHKDRSNCKSSQLNSW